MPAAIVKGPVGRCAPCAGDGACCGIACGVCGVRSDVMALMPVDTGSSQSVDTLAQSLTGGAITAATRETIKARSSDAPTIAGLILGSPEFQRQ